MVVQQIVISHLTGPKSPVLAQAQVNASMELCMFFQCPSVYMDFLQVLWFSKLVGLIGR